MGAIADAIDQKFGSRRILLQTFGGSVEAQDLQGAALQAFLEKHGSLRKGFRQRCVRRHGRQPGSQPERRAGDRQGEREGPPLLPADGRFQGRPRVRALPQPPQRTGAGGHHRAGARQRGAGEVRDLRRHQPEGPEHPGHARRRQVRQDRLPVRDDRGRHRGRPSADFAHPEPGPGGWPRQCRNPARDGRFPGLERGHQRCRRARPLRLRPHRADQLDRRGHVSAQRGLREHRRHRARCIVRGDGARAVRGRTGPGRGAPAAEAAVGAASAHAVHEGGARSRRRAAQQLRAPTKSATFRAPSTS